ncbi:D-tyrosyl-tRNA(Tyr) deacylase [Candidatus Woesebacteria bacterium]|nr:MAG: D-tyrosyl-tRNA(Tyr) deacylase [Candidatus Woesebacteria bacterium]
MKIVVQRVLEASVSVDDEVVGEINKGFFILVGITQNDTVIDANILAEKIVKLRIISDSEGKMNLSLIDANESVLVVSQFTLFANTKKGNRPSFVDAADSSHAEKIYRYFVDKLVGYGINVKTGKFGEYMQINTTLDGPVTIIIDTKQ